MFSLFGCVRDPIYIFIYLFIYTNISFLAVGSCFNCQACATTSEEVAVSDEAIAGWSFVGRTRPDALSHVLQEPHPHAEVRRLSEFFWKGFRDGSEYGENMVRHAAGELGIYIYEYLYIYIYVYISIYAYNFLRVLKANPEYRGRRKC